MPKLKVTHTYQRYNLEQCFGIINGSKPGIFYTDVNSERCPKRFISATGEFATVWNIRTSEKVLFLKY